MNRISRLLNLQMVYLDVSVSNKKRLFEQASLLFENSHRLERSKVFDALFARERLGSTGLGHGVAIPHGRLRGLKQAVGAIVRLTEPIAFDAPDEANVGLFVFLLVPENANEEHLEILSELAEVLSDDEIRSKLMTLADPSEIHQALNAWVPYRPTA
jgi:nitrogen PTS system EIIA component